jgi:hypothetical protein
MLALSQRLVIPGIISLILFGLLFYKTEEMLSGLGDPAIISGWALILLMVSLALINTRKKLVAFNLGRIKHWLAFHIVGGFLAVAIFLLHTGSLFPLGLYEQILSILFWLVSFTGVWGMMITIFYPRRLTEDNDTEITYERVPSQIFEMRKQAEAEVLACTEASGQSTLSQHYEETLYWFFKQPRFYWNHAIGGEEAFTWIRQQGTAVKRYLNEKETSYLNRIIDLAETKAKTDKHYACQDIMRKWLLVHVPLSVAVLGMSVWHIFLIHVYSS